MEKLGYDEVWNDKAQRVEMSWTRKMLRKYFYYIALPGSLATIATALWGLSADFISIVESMILLSYVITLNLFWVAPKVISKKFENEGIFAKDLLDKLKNNDK